MRGLFLTTAFSALLSGCATVPPREARCQEKEADAVSTYILPGTDRILREGIEYRIEDVLVAQPQKGVISSKLKRKMKTNMTMRDLVDVLGHGWMSKYSGLGVVKWFFADGTVAYVIVPSTLDKPVDVGWE